MSRSRRDSLQRRQGNRTVRQRFLILCEGEVTETDYLKYLRKQLRGTLVNIEISDERGDPLRLVKQAVRIQGEAAAKARQMGDQNIRFDSVWCVCDVDNHPRLSEAIRAAERSGINLAISNPCFELWLILHFRDYQASATQKRLREALRQYIPGYQKRLDCELLGPGHRDAMRRAAELDQLHSRLGRSGVATNPSTGVRALVDELERTAGSPIAGGSIAPGLGDHHRRL